MKKLFVLAGAVVLSSSLFAQKPSSSDSKYSLEGNINYDATNGINWTAPNLRARYFVNDNIAARFQLGLGSTSDKVLVYDGADTTNSTTGSVTDKSSSWAMQLGAEYHLKGSDKMSPYFMAGINFGGMSQKTIGADVDTSDDYLKGVGYTDKSSSSMFGIGLGAGMDYYIADNLYLGLELGWNWTKMTDRGSSFEVTGANPSETTFPSAGNSSGMGIGAMNTAFRIGWRF